MTLSDFMWEKWQTWFPAFYLKHTQVYKIINYRHFEYIHKKHKQKKMNIGNYIYTYNPHTINDLSFKYY